MVGMYNVSDTSTLEDETVMLVLLRFSQLCDSVHRQEQSLENPVFCSGQRPKNFLQNAQPPVVYSKDTGVFSLGVKRLARRLRITLI